MKDCHPKTDAPRAHKYLAVLSAILIGGLLMGCEESAVKKAAQAADGFAISVKALQQAEMAAHVQGLIDDAEHRDLQGYFLDVASAGLELDNAIRVAQSKPKAVETLQAAIASLDRMLNQAVPHLKNPKARETMQALILSAKSFLATIAAVIG